LRPAKREAGAEQDDVNQAIPHNLELRRASRLWSRRDLVYAESRCTVAGEKAGKQIAMYSAPSADGVL
jgi:hypothetical protein